MQEHVQSICKNCVSFRMIWRYLEHEISGTENSNHRLSGGLGWLTISVFHSCTSKLNISGVLYHTEAAYSQTSQTYLLPAIT